VLQEKEDRLKTVTDNLGQMDSYLSQRKDYEGVNSTRLFNEKQLDSLANVAGFADSNWALGQLSYNVDGSRDLDTYMAISFIGYLFILFECLPVFVKLMSPKGPYDTALAKTTEANNYYADKDKDRDIAVTDNTYDHSLDTDIDRRKQIITAQSEYDLGRQSYD
jgi:hypothetical protein